MALTAADAFAYLDPGTGSLALQALISGLLGALFLARRAIRQVTATVARRLGLRCDSEPTNAGPEHRPQ